MEFKSGQRSNPRIDFPATVIIQDQEIEVLDWSLGGFAIPDSLIQEEDFSTSSVTFKFALSQGFLTLELESKAVRTSSTGYAVGFQFVELSNAVKDTLENIVGCYLSGEKINLNQSIDLGVKGKLFEYERVRLISNWSKFALVSLGTFAILGFALLMLYQKLFDVKSEYAAVAQSIIEIPSTRAGNLQDLNIVNGEEVKLGQPIFSIVSEDQNNRLREMQSSLSKLDIDIFLINRQYTDALSLLNSYSDRLDTERSSLVKRIKVLNSEIQIQEKQYNILNSPVNIGAVDDITKNETLIALYNKRRVLIELREKLNINSNNRNIVRNGIFTDKSSSNLSSINEIKNTLEYKKKQKNLIEQKIKALKDSFIYRAPCNCTVAGIAASPGPVTAEKTIVKFSSNRGEKWVLALVPLEQADRIYKGSVAQFRLAGSDTIHTGSVAEVSYFSATDPEVYGANGESISGLPKALPRMQQFTLVKIKPEKPIQNAEYKEPASVSIKLGLWQSIKREVFL
jgi:multidrug resistance efflux pump